MLAELGRIGFVEICVTPHQRNGFFIPTAAAIAAALDQLRGESIRLEPKPRLRLGAENYWDDVFVERLRQHAVPCYEGQRAFLFEVNPVLPPPNLGEALFELRLRGTLPVMAHPERCLPVQREAGFAEALAKQAALLVDLGTLAGGHSRAETKAARRLVEAGLAAAVASDLHSPEESPDVFAGIAWIERRLGAAGVARLLEENPRRILGGELP